MNKFKLLAFLLPLWASLSGIASADGNKPFGDYGFVAPGVGIGSGQYLGLYLSNPPAPVKSTSDSDALPVPLVCNLEISLLGMNWLPVGATAVVEEVSQGETVFVKVAEAASDATMPEYFKVNVKLIKPVITDGAGSSSSSNKGLEGCRGVTAMLGVYDKLTNNLQVTLPIPANPPKK